MAAPALLGRLSPTCGSSLIAGEDSKNKITYDCNGSVATNGDPAHANYYNYNDNYDHLFYCQVFSSVTSLA